MHASWAIARAEVIKFNTKRERHKLQRLSGWCNGLCSKYYLIVAHKLRQCASSLVYFICSNNAFFAFIYKTSSSFVPYAHYSLLRYFSSSHTHTATARFDNINLGNVLNTLRICCRLFSELFRHSFDFPFLRLVRANCIVVATLCEHKIWRNAATCRRRRLQCAFVFTFYLSVD